MAENPFDLSNAPTTEPVSILAGYWVGWRRELDYDDALFTLSYEINDTDHSITVTGSKSGDFWQFEILSADTAAFNTSTYRWDLIVTRISDGEKFVHSTGQLQGYATNADRRTHAEVMVKKIESILNGRADHDVESYSIKNRSITKMSVKELTEWRNYYLAEIQMTGGSDTNASRPKKNTVRVRFV